MPGINGSRCSPQIPSGINGARLQQETMAYDWLIISKRYCDGHMMSVHCHTIGGVGDVVVVHCVYGEQNVYEINA